MKRIGEKGRQKVHACSRILGFLRNGYWLEKGILHDDSSRTRNNDGGKATTQSLYESKPKELCEAWFSLRWKQSFHSTIAVSTGVEPEPTLPYC